jgi:hypothetical protein
LFSILNILDTIDAAQQQKLQRMQNNQTSSSLTKQQLLNGNSFQIDNMTFSHRTASVNGIQLHYVIGGHGNPVVLLTKFMAQRSTEDSDSRAVKDAGIAG